MSTSTINQLTLKATLDGTEIFEISEGGSGSFKATISSITVGFQATSEKGAANGYAGLDSSSLLQLANFPTGTGLQVLRRNTGNTALEFATISAGGETFTWTADHSMATFKLTATAANNVILNAPTGQGISIEVNAVQQYLFNATQADYLTNNIINVGNLTMSKTGDTRVLTFLRNEVLADDTIIAQILFEAQDSAAVIEQYVRIDAIMESDIVDDEDGSYHVHVAEAGTFNVKYMAFNDAKSGLIDLLKPVNFNSQNLTNAVLITPTIAATGFTNMQHTHQAANTGSLLVATLALTATGTTDSTTFLRGDDTWAVPPNTTALTINRAVITDGSGLLTVSAVTNTELGFVSGVSSAIQTQLDSGVTNNLDDRWKKAVRVATVIAGTLATDFEDGDTVDTIVLSTGDRILLQDQATASENGIYTVNATGAPTRAIDWDTGTQAEGAIVYSREGTENGTKAWKVDTVGTITIGTTAVVITEFGAAGFAFPYIQVVSPADVTVNNTTTTVVITDLDFELEAAKEYEGYIVLFVKSSTAANMRMTFVGPTGMVGSLGAAGLNDMTQLVGSDVGSSTTSEDRNSIYVPFAINNPTNAGTFTVEFAQLAATVVDTTVFKNSLLFIREVVS